MPRSRAFDGVELAYRVLEGAAHHPGMDERDAFVTAVSGFLRG